MARLIHLNGPPGIGKSTIARRYVEDNPGTLNLDIDVLRTLIGGWADDFERAGALIRPVAQSAITAYLGDGGDVVMPQLTARQDALDVYRIAAAVGGGQYVHLVLTASREATVRRFHARQMQGPLDPAGATSRYVAGHGGDDLLNRYYDEVSELAAIDPEAVVIAAGEGDVDGTYGLVCRALGATSSNST